MIALARELDLRVIAEGVESLGQLDILRDMGVVEVQGFLFSRPVSEPVFSVLVASGAIGAA